MDWSFVAKKAFNIYFEDFLENKDHSIAQNSTNKFIKLFAIKAGLKFINLSSNNIPQKNLIVIFNQFADKMSNVEFDKNYIVMKILKNMENLVFYRYKNKLTKI